MIFALFHLLERKTERQAYRETDRETEKEREREREREKDLFKLSVIQSQHNGVITSSTNEMTSSAVLVKSR